MRLLSSLDAPDDDAAVAAFRGLDPAPPLLGGGGAAESAGAGAGARPVADPVAGGARGIGGGGRRHAV